MRTGQLMVIGWSGSGKFMNETSQDTVKILLKYRTSPANVYWKHSDYKHSSKTYPKHHCGFYGV